MWHRRPLREALSGMQGEEGDTMSEVEDNLYDVDRFRRVMAGITDDVLDMDTWAEKTPCGTVACFAGHVVLEAGEGLDFQENEDGEVKAHTTETGRYIPTRATELLVPGPPEPPADKYMFVRDAPPAEVHQARERLRNLFLCTGVTTKDQLWNAIEDYTEGMVTRS